MAGGRPVLYACIRYESDGGDWWAWWWWVVAFVVLIGVPLLLLVVVVFVYVCKLCAEHHRKPVVDNGNDIDDDLRLSPEVAKRMRRVER